jgi:hypothetical protein
LTDQGVFENPGGSAMDAATTPLMQDYAYGTTAPATVTVSLTGLTPYVDCAFTLVIYGAGDTSGQGVSLQLTAGATGGNTASNLTTSATSRQLSAGIGVAYNTFTGILTNGILTFVATNNGSIYTIVNGFQLELYPAPPVIGLQPNGQGVFVLNWSGGNLLQATNLLGPWTTNTTATSPLTVVPDPGVQQQYYRVHSP